MPQIAAIAEWFRLNPAQGYVLLGGAVILLLWLSRIYWRNKLTRWAREQGYTLIRYRGAWFFEGPSAWRRSKNQHAFRVVVEDRNGLRRSCWIMFGTFWGFTWGNPVTAVEWDNDTDY